VPIEIRAALAALPIVAGAAWAGIAIAQAGPVQPGVTTPSAPAAPAPDADQPPELRTASPQGTTPAPRPRPKPDQPETPAPAPPPHEIHVGDFSAPVPDAVPGDVVNGLNSALNPGMPPTQR
jgi:hypothetical protein